MIHGDRFVPFADIVYAWRGAPPLPDDLLLRRIEAFGDDPVVVYSDTDQANRLNRVLARAAGARVVLVTHNGDACVGVGALRAFDADFSLIAPCVRRWFAQNTAVRDPRLEPLPIGLERPHIARREAKAARLAGRFGGSRKTRRLLYLNHAVQTNPAEREKPYRLFEGQPYALVRRGMNGKGYAAYLADLATSAYCISPPGNGLDCHRTWEALYLGCVPIVKRSVMSEALYTGLPVLLVDDYEEVNERVLREALPRFPRSAFDDPRLFIGHYRGSVERRCQEIAPAKRLRDPRLFFLARLDGWLRAR